MIDTLKATEALMQRTDESLLVVPSLGNPVLSLFNAADRPGHFYTRNSMGQACSIGLGLAMAQPSRRVAILDGDGSLLMNLGSLATEAWKAPKNLIHICWDNRLYEMTGKQPTATSGPTDLAAIAQGSGYRHVARVETQAALETALDEALASDEGPWFILGLVTPDRAMRSPKAPKSPTGIRHRFDTAINPE